MSAATLGSHDYSYLIGSDLKVGYADQNESFAAYLPRTGTVVRQITLEDWGGDWLVLQLHEPFEYQLGSLEAGFSGTTVTTSLFVPAGRGMLSVRSRLPFFSFWISIKCSTRESSFVAQISFRSVGV